MEGSMSDAAMQFVESFRQQLEQCSSASEDGIFESLRERLHPYCYPQLLNGLGFFAQELSNTRSVTSDSADVTVNFGSPAHSILKIMESQQIDLVVMSSQCKQGISARIAAHLSESLTYAVAAQAACPVLAVPPAKRQIGLCSMGL